MTQEKIAGRLQQAVDLTGLGLAEAGYPERVQAIRGLIAVGEYRLATEDLSSNLCEFDCPVPVEAPSALRELSDALGLPEEAWRDLEAQAVPS